MWTSWLQYSQEEWLITMRLQMWLECTELIENVCWKFLPALAQQLSTALPWSCFIRFAERSSWANCNMSPSNEHTSHFLARGEILTSLIILPSLPRNNKVLIHPLLCAPMPLSRVTFCRLGGNLRGSRARTREAEILLHIDGDQSPGDPLFDFKSKPVAECHQAHG